MNCFVETQMDGSMIVWNAACKYFPSNLCRPYERCIGAGEVRESGVRAGNISTRGDIVISNLQEWWIF
jgi:hypothetical protein